MTVAELIATLQQLPQDKPVVLEDPDTDWDLLISVRNDADAVRIHSDYGARWVAP